MRFDENRTSKEKIAFTKNVFPLQQVKKMIGKKLIILMPNIVVTIQDKNNAKVLKAKILEQHATDKATKCKNVVITVMYNNGISYAFKHVDVYLAIGSISYKEMTNVGDTIMVTVQQYPKLSKTELKKIL
jgi:hypothetical protein